MFDYVRSSYYFSDDFSGECQTKDIERGIGGTMSHYWISPDGQLYRINYDHTADFVELKEGDDGYEPEPRLGLFNFRWIPNGKRGRVEVMPLTEYVTIYPSNWGGRWEDWPECRIHFVKGVVESYETNIKGNDLRS